MATKREAQFGDKFIVVNIDSDKAHIVELPFNPALVGEIGTKEELENYVADILPGALIFEYSTDVGELIRV